MRSEARLASQIAINLDRAEWRQKRDWRRKLKACLASSGGNKDAAIAKVKELQRVHLDDCAWALFMNWLYPGRNFAFGNPGYYFHCHVREIERPDWMDPKDWMDEREARDFVDGILLGKIAEEHQQRIAVSGN